MILDVTDPAEPVLVDDSDYPTPDRLKGSGRPEGNAHQAWWSSNNRFIVGTDEVLSPLRTSCRIKSGENTRRADCVEFDWTSPVRENFPGGLDGRAVFGGSGCVEDVDGNGTGDRDELPERASTRAEIIAFTRGGCYFSNKVESAQLAGYAALVVGNSHAGSNGPTVDDFFCGTKGHRFEVTAAGLCIGHGALHELFDDLPEFEGPDGADLPKVGTLGHRFITQGSVLQGWGYVHLLNADTLEEIDVYVAPDALEPRSIRGPDWFSVHEVQTDPRPNVNLAYFSYYNAGFRVARFGPNGIDEVGHYVHADGNDFWGVEPTTAVNPGGRGSPLLLLSDRDSGLWIFRYTAG